MHQHDMCHQVTQLADDSITARSRDEYEISSPMATAGSPGGVGLVMKSPRRAGRSYTQLGNTGLGCVGFFLLCLSLSIFRVTSAGCR